MGPLVLLAALLGASTPESLTGTVQVGRGNLGAPAVALLVAGKAVELAGELVAEVQNLQSAEIEVSGLRDGARFVVQAYSIRDLGKGLKPNAIGLLGVAADGSLTVSDGDGAPVPLSAAPRMRLRLEKYLGAKVWVAGEKLLSGAIKVAIFGVLREPPKPKPPAATAAP